MSELAPEAKAREQIDALLVAAGWTLQDCTRFDASASRTIALREIPVTGGRCDYLLLIDRNPVGVIEAKKVGTTLSMVAEQSAYYGSNLPEFLRRSTGPLPFYYESTGVETFFRDSRDPESRSRRVFAFHRPETLHGWLQRPLRDGLLSPVVPVQ
jgi:type I restriction enzyme, R subunit